MKKGLFITFEGGEACGKTTQVELLKDYFKKNFSASDYIFIREPGGTPLAEKIRELLLSYKEDAPLPMTELLLFYASRYQNCFKNVIPALNEGKIVVCDRFYDSTLAYQGEARKILSIEDIYRLTKLVIGDLKPDLTFYLKLSPEEAFKRKNPDVELDRMESEGLEFHKAVARGYDYIANLERERFVIIDASLRVEEIFTIIIDEIQKRLDSN